MSKQNRKKMGYKQYEQLLATAHQRIEFLASKYQELQSYFIAYVEYRGDNIAFNGWMNNQIKEAQDKQEKEEKTNEKV